MRRLLWWLAIGVVVALAVLVWRSGPSVQPGSWLRVELQGEYVETQVSPFQRLLGGAQRTLTGQLSELAKAERDDRIEGVLVTVRALDLGWAKAQDLRRALVRLREKGKRTVAYVELEKYGANLEYYVASAAEQVYVAPGTRNPFVGLAAEYLFLGGLFEKLGVELEYERIGKYKTAAESLAESAMSEANREMSAALLDSIERQFLADVGASRGLAPEEVAAIVDRAPVSPEELQKNRLIDGALFVDDILENEGHPPVVEPGVYAEVDASEIGFEPAATFALIYGAGSVVVGEGRMAPGGAPVMSSESLAKAFEQAAESDEVRAIVFRIDSPGGSALASDLIWHAVRRARAKGKPVVASLSDVAASGGYYAAAGADRIVAQPGTLTGSIGVFVIRPVIAGALEKLGIGYASLTRGRHAGLLLSTEPLSEEAREHVREEVRGIYRQFVGRVAEGRHLDFEQVNEVGRGRVWTGAQAKEVGLVDTLGGLREAVLEAKELVGLAPDADVVLVPFPAPRPLYEQLRDALEGSAAARARSLTLDLLPRRTRAALDLLRELPTGVPVLIPPVFAEVR